MSKNTHSSQATIPTLKADLIWMAKGHYFSIPGQFQYFPKLNTIIAVTQQSEEAILRALAEITCDFIMASELPSLELFNLLLYSQRIVISKLEKVEMEKQSINPYELLKNHTIEYLMVYIAGQKLPDTWVLPAPTWNPDMFKKKKKEIR